MCILATVYVLLQTKRINWKYFGKQFSFNLKIKVAIEDMQSLIT